MQTTLKTAGAVVLALSFALPAMAAAPQYGDKTPLPPTGKAKGSPTATESTGGAGIQSAQQAKRVTDAYHAGKTGPTKAKGYTGSTGAGSAAPGSSR